MNCKQVSAQKCARWGGLLYLTIILLGLYGELFVRGTLVVPGDAAATAQAIAHSQLLWRSGITADLLMHLCDLPLIVILYVLLRPVSRSLALLATAINLVQTAVLVTNKLLLLLPLFLLPDATNLKSFSPEQLQAFSYLAIKLHGYGFAVGLIFFGFACLVRACLIYRSGYLPKILGILLSLAGLSYVINSFALLMAPAVADSLYPGILLPALVGELSLCLWLIFKGIDPLQWQQRLAVGRASHT